MDKLNEFKSRQRASETYRGSGGEVGGNVEDILKRLGAIESTASDTRAKVSEICGILPTLASKADVAALEAKMESRLGALDAKLEQRFGSLDAKVEQRLGSLDAKLESKFGVLEEKIAKGDAYITRWIITFGTAAVIGIAGMIFTLWKTAAAA
jgi:hypothetical protein